MQLKLTGILFSGLIAATLMACSAAPPSTNIVTHDSTLSRQQGVLLLVDVCIQKDGLGDSGDSFIIAESKYGAGKTMDALRFYVTDSDIPINAEIITVCAAKHGDKTTIRASAKSGAEIHNVSQPIYADSTVLQDADYLHALSDVSTYAFERAALNNSKADTNNTAKAINNIKFLAAAEIIQLRTGASSILYTGILGTSRSGGKALAQGVGSFLVGMGTGIATAGLGASYYVMFMPGQSISGRFMEGALIDLESGELTWSNAVKVAGNPAKAETWSSPDPLDLLFHDLFFQKTGFPY